MVDARIEADFVDEADAALERGAVQRADLGRDVGGGDEMRSALDAGRRQRRVPIARKHGDDDVARSGLGLEGAGVECGDPVGQVPHCGAGPLGGPVPHFDLVAAL